MSFELDHISLEGAEKIVTTDEMYRLGIEASTPGLGCETNLIAAHKWFNLAAMQGNEMAKEYRQQLTIEMTPADVAAAQREAREWLKSRRPALSA
ncbi:MAG: hypothetical protein AAF986_01385 [Pseudomonadota bacterium]